MFALVPSCFWKNSLMKSLCDSHAKRAQMMMLMASHHSVQVPASCDVSDAAQLRFHPSVYVQGVSSSSSGGGGGRSVRLT
jgi:alanyl-tRNA synthetase